MARARWRPTSGRRRRRWCRPPGGVRTWSTRKGQPCPAPRAPRLPPTSQAQWGHQPAVCTRLQPLPVLDSLQLEPSKFAFHVNTHPPPRGGHSGHYRRPCCCRSPSPCTDSPRPYRCPSKLAPHLAHLEAGAGLLGRSVRCTPGFCPCKPAAPTSGPTLGPLRTAPWLGLAGESPGQSGAPRTR